MDLSRKILSDPVNRWLFSQAGNDIFLVGGYIRDLLNRDDISKDKDYVLKDNAKEIARITSKKFNGTFIELKKNQMFRVALKDGRFLDFSKMRSTILKDLGTRDFRINAMAWAPETGLLDPFDGKKDLTNRIIRIITPKNLAEDPLRVFRAYRLAAQLGFTIDRDTRHYLRKYGSRLKESASERITEELFKLLMTSHAYYYISMSAEDKVLNEIINVTAYRTKINIAILSEFDQFASSLRSGRFKKVITSRILPVLDHIVGQGLNRAGLIRLSIILRTMKSGRNITSENLKFSNSIMKRVRNIQNGIRLGNGRITEGKLFDIFKAVDECVYETALLISLKRQRNVDKFLKRADTFIKFKKNLLFDGYEIQKILNIDPSPLIRDIQAEIHKRRFLGIIRTKAEAKHWILSNFT